MRLSTALTFAMVVVLGSSVYRVANQYEATERKMARVENKIDGEQEAMRVLQAEWTFLTSPSRLEKISQSFLGLESMDGSQYITLASVPLTETLDQQEKPVEEVSVASADEQSPEMANNNVVQTLPKMERPLPELTATPVNVTSGGQ